mmetsp:Transcript_36031/g.58135  ORF Transcript_36031/g.58135 Transcript_36031/m.58135 type:complete len:274 (-) Transcript_36031:321-1142(-)
MQSKLAVVEVCTDLCRVLVESHGNSQALNEENRVRIDLHSPRMVLVAAFLLNFIPDFEENFRIQSSSKFAAHLTLQVTVHDCRYQIIRNNFDSVAAVNGPLITGKYICQVFVLPSQKALLVGLRPKHDEAKDGVWPVPSVGQTGDRPCTGNFGEGGIWAERLQDAHVVHGVQNPCPTSCKDLTLCAAHFWTEHISPHCVSSSIVLDVFLHETAVVNWHPRRRRRRRGLRRLGQGLGVARVFRVHQCCIIPFGPVRQSIIVSPAGLISFHLQAI